MEKNEYDLTLPMSYFLCSQKGKNDLLESEEHNGDNSRVNHPDHYNKHNIEVIDFINDWNLDFSLGNVVKYVARSPYKGTELDDLKKAKWYLENAIKMKEGVCE